MDEDLDKMDRDGLLSVAKALRAAIRSHRDCSGHDLCWFHPEMWCLLPEAAAKPPAVPPWPEFLNNCAIFRGTLERPETTEGVDRSMIDASVVSLDWDRQEAQLQYSDFDGGVKLGFSHFPCDDMQSLVGKRFKLFRILVKT